jgi:hypothetical protein
MSESTAINHTTRVKDSPTDKQLIDPLNDRKENTTYRTIYAIKEEVIPMDTVDPRMLSMGLSTPSRAKDRCGSQMSGMRTPGQREYRTLI